MRLNELDHQKDEIYLDDSDINDFLHKVETECSDVLGSIRATNKGCFRGSNRKNTIFLGTPRQDRKPLDSSWMMHHAYLRMYAEHNIKANRQNSTFVTSDANLARFYGPVFAIFPRNGFSYSWSPMPQAGVDIAVPKEDEIKFLDMNKVEQLNAEGANYRCSPLAVEHGLSPDNVGKPFQWNHKKNIFVNLLTAKTYFNMPVETTDYAASQYIDTDRLYKNFPVIDTRFNEALTMEHEIAINGSYYGFSVKYCGDLLIKLIGLKAMSRAIRNLT